jgi:hypothetical protein
LALLLLCYALGWSARVLSGLTDTARTKVYIMGK